MIVLDYRDLDDVIKEMSKAKEIAFDTETVDIGYPRTTVTGMSFSWDDGVGCYIPVGHHTGELQLPAEDVYAAVKPILEDPNKLLYAHNMQYDWKVATLMGIRIPQNFFDTFIASVMDFTEGDHDLKYLSETILKHKMVELADLAPKEKHPFWKNDKVYRTDLVPIKDLGSYAWDDAVQTRRLGQHYKPIIERDYPKVFYELMMPMVLCLSEMEAYGVYVNKEKLRTYGLAMEKELAIAREKLFSLRPKHPGVEFNLNSTKQLNEVLFEECGIKPIGMLGKSGNYSTNAEVLETLEFQGHEIATAILRFRELDKLHGTYIVSMSKAIHTDGRLYAKLSLGGARTGRLSSSKPNLQNLPTNKEFPVRDAFEKTPTHLSPTGKPRKLVVLDMSQLELRVLAHMSQDPIMVDVYVNQGGDLHSETCRSTFPIEWKDEATGKILKGAEIPLKIVKKHFSELRRASKPVNFGIVYGISDTKLAKGINKEIEDRKNHVTKRDAGEKITKFLNRYRGVSQWIDWEHSFASKHGYVTTITKRKRHLPDAKLSPYSKDTFAKQSGAMRQAQNTPIQGSAGDIMYIAMRNIRTAFIEKGWWGVNAMLVNQVHDELCCDCDEDISQEVFDIMKHHMENAVKLRVPLEAAGTIGDTWFECK